MKRFAILSLVAGAITPAFAATDIGVSIGINQPGVYGRVDVGNVPPPPVVYAQPVIIAPTTYAYQQQPIYLYVPVPEQQHWSRYCHRYAACGQPVYFVQEQWVRERYERAHHDWRDQRQDRRHHEKHWEHDRGHGEGRWNDNRR